VKHGINYQLSADCFPSPVPFTLDSSVKIHGRTVQFESAGDRLLNRDERFGVEVSPNVSPDPLARGTLSRRAGPGGPTDVFAPSREVALCRQPAPRPPTVTGQARPATLRSCVPTTKKPDPFSMTPRFLMLLCARCFVTAVGGLSACRTAGFPRRFRLQTLTSALLKSMQAGRAESMAERYRNLEPVDPASFSPCRS